jgi:hypothetical protein
MSNRDKWISFLTALMVLLAAIISIIAIAHGCSTSSNKAASPPAPAAETCDGMPIGTAQTNGPCPAGEVGAETTVCQVDAEGAAQWTLLATTCAPPPNPSPAPAPAPSPTPTTPVPGPSPVSPVTPVPAPAPVPAPPPTCPQVTFDQNVQPIMQANCAACHSPTYQTTQVLGPAEMARRVALPVSDSDHMPQPIGNASPVMLSPGDITTIQTWYIQGAAQNCSSASGAAKFIDLAYQDSAALNDAEALPAVDQPTTEYLYAGDLVDEGFPIATAVQAINKALNGTNNDTNVVAQIVPVDPQGAVYRVDLNAFGIQAGDLSAILAADVNLNITDNTSKGKALTAVLGHKPWLHLNNWIDITYRNSTVYRQLIGNPANVTAFQQIFGINFEQDLETLLGLNFIGSTSSPIAEQKNRLIVRAAGVQTTSCYWQTFDVNATPNNVQVLVNGAETLENTKNLKNFPLLANAGALTRFGAAQAVYTPDASESIGCAPNGFLQYFLSDGAGNPLNFADPNVVIDTATPLGNKDINEANSCGRCHNAGFIPLADQILQSDGNTTLLSANDVQIVRVLYGADAAAAALFKKDSSIFLQAMSLAGIAPGPDPMSEVTDDYLLNYDLTQVSSRLFLTPDEFTTCLSESAASNIALGNVLSTGGQVTFTQFTAALPQLIIDCDLFQDPIGG